MDTSEELIDRFRHGLQIRINLYICENFIEKAGLRRQNSIIWHIKKGALKRATRLCSVLRFSRLLETEETEEPATPNDRYYKFVPSKSSAGKKAAQACYFLCETLRRKS